MCVVTLLLCGIIRPLLLCHCGPVQLVLNQVKGDGVRGPGAIFFIELRTLTLVRENGPRDDQNVNIHSALRTQEMVIEI